MGEKFTLSIIRTFFTLFQHQREANVIFMSWIKGQSYLSVSFSPSVTHLWFSKPYI